MQLNILEDKKNKLVFEVDETHTLCNLLRHELHQDDKVKIATYMVEHPLINKVKMVIETDDIDPRKALANAVSRLRKQFDAFEKQVAEEIK